MVYVSIERPLQLDGSCLELRIHKQLAYLFELAADNTSVSLSSLD